jgi:hypothetical protein
MCEINELQYDEIDESNLKIHSVIIKVCAFKSRNLMHLKSIRFAKYWESDKPNPICMQSVKFYNQKFNLNNYQTPWYNVLFSMSYNIYKDNKINLKTPLPTCLNNIVGEYLGLNLIDDIWSNYLPYLGGNIEYKDTDIYDSDDDDDDDEYKQFIINEKINTLDITQYNIRQRIISMHVSEFQELIYNIKKYDENSYHVYDKYSTVGQTILTYTSYRHDYKYINK